MTESDLIAELMHAYGRISVLTPHPEERELTVERALVLREQLLPA